MRKTFIFLPLLIAATPAAAQPMPQLPPELTDPATAERLGRAMQAVSDAMLDVRIGEVRAALEGRPASPGERNMTVRDMARRDDPDFDRHMHERMASIGPKMQRSMQAVNRALPIVVEDLRDARRSIERAIANMPDPNYPQR